ncbi:MAG: RDD family protein [Planctomycetota bacterium]
MNPNPSPPKPAPHAERVRGTDGHPYWKLTCFCGKVLLAPGDGPHKHGGCPKCGTRLLFPTDRPITSGPLPVIPARKPQRSAPRPVRPTSSLRAKSSKRMPESERDSSKDRINPGHSASDNAADKLRPSSVRVPQSATGLVSAWPLAEPLPRALAAFIDVTLTVACLAVLLATSSKLPTHFSSTTFRIAFTLLAMWLNEGVLQWLWHGSVGKNLCRITLREAGGEPLRLENALLRPFLKAALLPLWPLVFFNVNRLAWHDRILGVVVLKGRASK